MHVKKLGMAMALVGGLGVSGAGQAVPIHLSVAGALQNGGSYSGTLVYESTASDLNLANGLVGIFSISDFDISVSTGNASTSFRFLPGTSGSDLARVNGSNADGDAIAINFFSLPLGSDPPVISLSVVFRDLQITPRPFDPNVAPSVPDFGEFQQVVVIEGVAVGGGTIDLASRYSFANPTRPADDLNLPVTSGAIRAAPEPATIALMGLGLAGLGVSRRRAH